MSGFNLAAKSKEDQDKEAIDLVASGVAYKERLAMPVVAELVAREQPEQLRAYFWGDCTITASSVSSSRIKMPRNMPEKRMKLKNSAIPDAFCLSPA
ncbi:DNA polymerase III subunit theta [Salmonella enterica]|nr:DNA polymerase III subunit theta [Salmonella enterica]